MPGVTKKLPSNWLSFNIFSLAALMNHLIYCTFVFQKHQGNLFYFFISLSMYTSLSCSKYRFVYLFFERASLKDYFAYPENQINHSWENPMLIIKIFIAPFLNKYLLILYNTFVSLVHSSQLSIFFLNTFLSFNKNATLGKNPSKTNH